MNEQLSITCLPDGTYHVKETEDKDESDPSDPAVDQTVKSVDDVMQLVQKFFADDASEDSSEAGAPDEGDAPASDPRAAWKQEASTRDPVSGRRM